ncbi:MAG: preprotein translocase subunit YajC [Prevotellaceae bacterium]|jgi:preprotein translocase subunit YajC|nr:preprotein translocase subunit YajC [Prevotellaceae bacterium]
MDLQTILLQAEGTGGFLGGGSQGLIMMVLLFVVFYFFLIRPQMKRQKEIKKFREALKVGDTVITSGGIYGKIKEMKEDYVMLEITSNATVKIDKGSVFATAADTQQK